MSDLDDEELEATRKLNGVDKERDIEKNIKRCEELIKPEHANWIGISNQLAIVGVLARIKELEEENKRKDMFVEMAKEVIENSILKQKVKDKIEELNNNRPYLMKFEDWRKKEYTNEDIIQNCIEVLEELLEDK